MLGYCLVEHTNQKRPQRRSSAAALLSSFTFVLWRVVLFNDLRVGRGLGST